MKDQHGDIVPNMSTAHFLLYKIVADVFETKYSNDELIIEQMIMDCMIHIGRTAGNKENIYAGYVFPSVVLTIKDYLELHKTKNPVKVNDETLSCKYEYKIITELVANGMEYD